MIGGTIVVVLLALGVLAWAVAPLLRKDAAETERVVVNASEEMDLASRKNSVLAALKDLEDDKASDKLGEDDYQDMHARLSHEAVQIMKRLDELEEDNKAGPQRNKTLQHPGAKARGHSV